LLELLVIETLRAAVVAAHPLIEENVKWNSPNFVFDGADRVTLRLNPKGGVQVIFHRGAKIRADADGFQFDDPTGLLTWPGPDRAILSVADDASAAALAPQLTLLVRRWIAKP
jgi:hypothetical protein